MGPADTAVLCCAVCRRTVSSRERWLTVEEQKERSKHQRKAAAPDLSASKQSFETTFAPASRLPPGSWKQPTQRGGGGGGGGGSKATGGSARGRTPTRRR
jgi:hypothetical protein